MEEKTGSYRRLSSWGILLGSFLAALFLALFMVQGLAAQTDVDETPTATPGADAATDSQMPSSTVTDTGSLTGTVTLTQTESVTETGTLTSTITVTTADTLTTPYPMTGTIYMPTFYMPIPKLQMDSTRVNSSNQWQVSWQSLDPGVEYQIQESQWPDFSNLILDQIVSDTSIDVSHSASAFNTYYYRVRAIVDGLNGPWSETERVAGAYFDNFSNPNTGWAMRRTTFLERTVSWYGAGNNAGNFIIVVDDRWDWMIASPLQAAPSPPYVIEYRSRVHDASNLVSGGLVVGGDWNYDACPEFGNVYQTDNCFNHFYNFNYIHYGAMKLLFEQVDNLTWCLGCGGSPLKRLGDQSNWREIDPIFGNSSARDWHTYRVEVRDDGLYLTIDGDYKGRFGSPAYVNDPFFGVFASTDEYKPSIWFFDYFKITPLDN